MIPETNKHFLEQLLLGENESHLCLCAPPQDPVHLPRVLDTPMLVLCLASCRLR